MLRGEIWFGVWPNDPQKKNRPLLIVSNDHRNSAANILDVVVVKVTSLERKDGSVKPINIAEDVVIQLKKKSILRCGSIYSVEKSFFLTKAAQLSPAQMKAVDEKLKNVLDLNS
ncbi:MAG: type II toxin-antitoxin system PemK/MazF family toxin [Pseudobdellovibrionaceae bacterium]